MRHPQAQKIGHGTALVTVHADSMSLPSPVTILLSEQLGVAARRQLLALHCRDKVIEGWLRYGHLERLHRGVYRAPGSHRSWEQSLLAAVLAAGPGARADGAASCALHGVEGFGKQGAPGVVVPVPRRIRRASFPAAARDLPAADLVTIGPIPALSAPRSIIETAAGRSDKQVRVAIDSAKRLGLLSIDLLARRARALGRHRGARRLLRLLATGELEQESEGERRLKRFLAPLDLDLAWGVTDVVRNRRLDALERSLMLCFEYDGRDNHVLPTDRDSDGLRDLECRAQGVEVVRVTRGMIDDAPERTLRWIRAVIGRRSAELGDGAA